MPHHLLSLVKEVGGVRGLLRLALYSRKFFRNWLTSLTTATLSYIGIAKSISPLSVLVIVLMKSL